MRPFFTRERFGQPQFVAGLLLLAFLAQCVWLTDRAMRRVGVSEAELFRIEQGLRQWHGAGIAGTPYCFPADQRPQGNNAAAPWEFGNSGGYDEYHSPLWYLTAAVPILFWPHAWQSKSMAYWGWLTRIPYLGFGLLLGASLWYVSRRLYGNMGGYIALTLYCFSPAIIRSAALWFAQPELGAAWGAFGAIFTAIAVAHTLYAPREVVLWNWRRIVLLGVSLAIAVGSQFSMIILAPIRRAAALTIWTSAVLLAAALLFAVYFFHPHAFSNGMQHASFWGATWRSFTILSVYRQTASQILRSCPALALLVPVALATYFVWPRTRYFGNTAPLLLALLFIVLGMAHPHVAGAGFLLASVPFILIFVSGILADLMETPYRPLVTACVWSLLGAYILWSLLALAQVPRG